MKQLQAKPEPMTVYTHYRVCWVGGSRFHTLVFSTPTGNIHQVHQHKGSPQRETTITIS